MDENVWHKFQMFCVKNKLKYGDALADVILQFIDHTGINSSSSKTRPQSDTAGAEKHYFVEDDVMARESIKKRGAK